MSNSSFFSGRRTEGKAPEKSNFAHTCNLLSQYIKGKGSLRDLNLEIGGKVKSLEAIVKPGSTHATSSSTATNLLTNKRKSSQISTEQQLSLDSSVITLEDANTASISNERTAREPKSAQLTIFYSGKVLVFDDYPAEKARKLVSLAKKESSQMSCGILSNTIHEKANIGSCSGGAVASTSREGLPPRPLAAGSGKQPVGSSSNSYMEKTNSSFNMAMALSSTAQENFSPQPEAEANGSDLPIARRSSLHRFLAKRKDRAVARGPYQIQEQPASSPKGEGQIDLNF